MISKWLRPTLCILIRVIWRHICRSEKPHHEKKSSSTVIHYVLSSGDSYEIQVNFSCSLVGFYPATLAFEFKTDVQTDTSFYIVRYIEAHCITALGKELAPIAPYKPKSLPAWVPETDYTIVDGLPPEGYHCPHTDKYEKCELLYICYWCINLSTLNHLARLSVMQLKNVVELKQYRMPTYMNNLINVLKHPAFKSEKR